MEKRFAAYQGAMPDAGQIALLKATFASELDEAAFRRWADGIDFDAEAGEAEMRLLPELSPRLQRAEIDHPLVPRIAGLHRRTLYANTIRFHRGLALHDALEAHGVHAILVGAAAAILQGGPGALARPMTEIELLVPETTDPFSVDRAAAQIEGLPLRCEVRVPGLQLFRDELGFTYRLAWRLEPHEGAAADELRLRAATVERDRRMIAALSPEQLVFQSIWHGMLPGGHAATIWVADVLSVIHSAPAFDWPRLVGMADRRGCREMVAAALDFILAEGLGEAGMAAARDTLMQKRDPWALRRALRLRAQPGSGPQHLVARFALPYLFTARGRGERPSFGGLVDHARLRWGAASRLAALRIGTAKMMRHALRRLPADLT